MLMDKSEILREFFSSGYLLSEEALEYLSTLPDDEVRRLSKIRYDSIVLMPDDIRKHTIEIREIKVIREVSKEVDVDDFVRFYQNKFNKLKKIITERHGEELISISNLSSRGRTVSIIGMVKDVVSNGKEKIVVEDHTGKITIISDKAAGVEIDDVLGFRVREGNNAAFLVSVIYPDIPIREPATGRGRAMFISEPRFDEAPQEDIERLMQIVSSFEGPVFFLGKFGRLDELEEMGKRAKIIAAPAEFPSPPLDARNVVSLSNPSMIEINGLKVLIVHDFNMDYLKKRYIGKGIVKSDVDMVIDEVPDIVFCAGSKPFVMNYKSTTIVCPGSLLEEFSPIVVDFRTRSVEKLRWGEQSEIPGN